MSKLFVTLKVVLRLGALAVTLPCGATFLGHTAFGADTQTPPSVILISVDSLRADHLSCYGYRRASTPHIDAMVRGATIFTQVSSQVTLTLPSHASLLTSTYPFADGVQDNAVQLGPDAVMLATVLKSHGYRTGAFVGGFVLDRRFGLNRGFNEYDSPFHFTRVRIRAKSSAWVKTLRIRQKSG